MGVLDTIVMRPGPQRAAAQAVSDEPPPRRSLGDAIWDEVLGVKQSLAELPQAIRNEREAEAELRRETRGMVDPMALRLRNLDLGSALLGVNPVKTKVLGELIATRLGAYPSTSPRTVLNRTAKQGGYSVAPATGDVPEAGLMIGKYKNTDPRVTVVPGSRKLTQADVQGHYQRNRKAFEDPDTYLGTWRDPATGNTYLDVVRRFPQSQVRKATKYGERTKQIAGYNVAKGEELPIGNWREFIQSPEYHARMDEMAKTGRDYLSKHPTQEWWDMHGTSFERVYGKENLPQVAGYTGATAPNAAPRENLQTMSEYMRRHLAGEPAIQPEWRVPEGMMSRQAGKKIGMEASRRANIEKTARGDLAALQGPKVREEAKALMGDPGAAVFDRHQIRLSEAPERGIYAAGRADTISPADYDRLLEQFRIGASRNNRNVRDYSADVWTGIRETIRTQNQLFGQKYRGSAISGESKSYADHFDDLIRAKAQHLKISVQEMERRLRNGDANLMSAVLATPIGLTILRMVTGENGGE